MHSFKTVFRGEPRDLNHENPADFVPTLSLPHTAREEH
jgi:hypothetical protein